MTRIRKISSPLPALAFCALLTLGVNAYAAGPVNANGKLPGCDDRIMKAMNDKANARVAYDVAESEMVIDKPDSVLAMSCFNNAAGESALQIGSMFSGDFTTQLGTIVPDSLQSFYDDFAGAVGNDTGVVDYTQTSLGTSIGTCTYPDDLWQQVKQEGIQKNMPYPLESDYSSGAMNSGSFTDLTGESVLGGSNFDNDVQKAEANDQDFSNVNGDISNLPKATTATTLMSSPTNTDDECAVLGKIGVGGATCP
jgi:hypothetical protein